MREPKKSNEVLKRAAPGLFLPGGDKDRRDREPRVVLLQEESECCRASPPRMNSDSDCACE